MRRVFFGFTSVAVALCSFGFGSRAGAQTFKVGYVFMDEIRQKAQPYQEALQSLQQATQQRQQEAQERQNEIQRLQDQLQRQASLLTEQVRTQKQGQIQQKLAEYEQWAGQAQTELQRQQLEIIQPIDERALQLVQRLAAERNYDLVLDGSAVAYLRNQEENNLTSAVIEALNQGQGVAPSQGTTGGRAGSRPQR